MQRALMRQPVPIEWEEQTVKGTADAAVEVEDDAASTLTAH